MVHASSAESFSAPSPMAISMGSAQEVAGNQDIERVQVRLADPLMLPGTAEADGVPLTGASVQTVYLGQPPQVFVPLPGFLGATPPISSPGGSPTQQQAQQRAQPQPPSPPEPGTFQTAVTPGQMYLAPRPRAGYYPESISLNGRNVTGQPIEVQAEGQLRVFYRAATGSVRGQVSGNGQWVILMPQNLTSIGYGHAARVGADGSFQIDGVAPGSYLAAAFSDPDLNDWRHERVIATIPSRGQRISIADGEAMNMRLTAMPWFE